MGYYSYGSHVSIMRIQKGSKDPEYLLGFIEKIGITNNAFRTFNFVQAFTPLY